MKPEMRVEADREAISRALAGEIVRIAHEAVVASERCSIALAGGSTPKLLYQLLAQEHLDELPWGQIEWFWGDERAVAPDQEQSNYRMVREALLEPARANPNTIHRVLGERGAAEASQLYEEEIRKSFGLSGSGPPPSLDLILLGLGGDGHTASLFPGDPALDVSDRWVCPSRAPEGVEIRERITMTFPLINAARRVFFLVAGSGKREILRQVLADTESAGSRYPAARVSPSSGKVTWWVDRDAYGESVGRA